MLNFHPTRNIPMNERSLTCIFQVRDAVLKNLGSLNLADDPVYLYDSLHDTKLEELPKPIIWYLVIIEKNNPSVKYDLSFCFGKITIPLLNDFVENTQDYRRTDELNQHTPVVFAQDISPILPEIIKLNKKEGLIALSMELVYVQDLTTLRYIRFLSKLIKNYLKHQLTFHLKYNVTLSYL